LGSYHRVFSIMGRTLCCLFVNPAETLPKRGDKLVVP
jgi:hypothetical protein